MLSVHQETFPYPIETVWAALTDLQHTQWRSDLERVGVMDDRHFVEYTKGGIATRFTVTAAHPPRHWAFAMENARMTGRWVGVLEPQGAATRVIFAESVFPKHRWLRPLVPAYLRRQQAQYCADLRRRLAEI